MEVTEKRLLDGLCGITNGADNVSMVGGVEVRWLYRAPFDGRNRCAVDSRKDAESISLEWERGGITIELDDGCEDHPALQRIHDNQQRLYGTRV